LSFCCLPKFARRFNLKKRVIEDESELYAHWFTAYGKKDMVRALGFANKYVRLRPSGQFMSYLERFLKQNLPNYPDALKIFEEEGMDKVVIEPTSEANDNARTVILSNFLEVPKDAVLGEGLLLLIIEEGASVDARSRSGYTALMLASLNGHNATVKQLLEKGANINFQEASHRFTPLAFAIASGNVETVRLLLENGANKFMKDTEGRNALDHAKLQGSAEIIQLINQSSAKK
jgi:ankyrin repeat protein